MKRTGVALPSVLALVGAVLSWLLDVGLASGGYPVLVPPVSLPIALLVIAAIVLGVGWPIRQSVRGTSNRRVDPFRAMRTVLLAKASTLAGSVLGGAAIGVAVYLYGRPIDPPVSVTITVIGTVATAAVLVASGLLVEHWCRIPPDDDDREPPRGLGLQGE